MEARGEKDGARISRGPSGSGALRGVRQRGGRLSRYGPLLVWMGIIFFASTGNLSAPNTSRIIRPVLLWLFPGITEATLLQVHFLVRKAAHFTEYAILALLASRAFLSSSRIFLRRRWWLASLALVASCALLDEYHQSFVSARTGTIYDSLLDISGGACALALAAVWRALRRRRSTLRR
ncbi:MAG: VanZ family protein [Acidobacteria bacterium]|nr:VanZ family protein [Acidobacteriota bacterium]